MQSDFSNNKMKNYSESELFRMIEQQNKAAFSELYDRHSAKFYGLSLKILKNPELAQDVLHDYFIKLWRKIPSYDYNSGNPLGWMIILCRNHCIDELRKLRNKNEKSSSYDENLKFYLSNDGVYNPAKEVNEEETKNKINEALDKIPIEQRNLIEKTYFEGFTHNELSENLNLPLGTVKTRIRSGMAKLKNLLSSKEGLL